MFSQDARYQYLASNKFKSHVIASGAVLDEIEKLIVRPAHPDSEVHISSLTNPTIDEIVEYSDKSMLFPHGRKSIQQIVRERDALDALEKCAQDIESLYHAIEDTDKTGRDTSTEVACTNIRTLLTQYRNAFSIDGQGCITKLITITTAIQSDLTRGHDGGNGPKGKRDGRSDEEDEEEEEGDVAAAAPTTKRAKESSGFMRIGAAFKKVVGNFRRETTYDIIPIMIKYIMRTFCADHPDANDEVTKAMMPVCTYVMNVSMMCSLCRDKDFTRPVFDTLINERSVVLGRMLGDTLRALGVAVSAACEKDADVIGRLIRKTSTMTDSDAMSAEGMFSAILRDMLAVIDASIEVPSEENKAQARKLLAAVCKSYEDTEALYFNMRRTGSMDAMQELEDAIYALEPTVDSAAMYDVYLKARNNWCDRIQREFIARFKKESKAKPKPELDSLLKYTLPTGGNDLDGWTATLFVHAALNSLINKKTPIRLSLATHTPLEFSLIARGFGIIVKDMPGFEKLLVYSDQKLREMRTSYESHLRFLTEDKGIISAAMSMYGARPSRSASYLPSKGSQDTSSETYDDEVLPPLPPTEPQVQTYEIGDASIDAPLQAVIDVITSPQPPQPQAPQTPQQPSQPQPVQAPAPVMVPTPVSPPRAPQQVPRAPQIPRAPFVFRLSHQMAFWGGMFARIDSYTVSMFNLAINLMDATSQPSSFGNGIISRISSALGTAYRGVAAMWSSYPANSVATTLRSQMPAVAELMHYGNVTLIATTAILDSMTLWEYTRVPSRRRTIGGWVWRLTKSALSWNAVRAMWPAICELVMESYVYVTESEVGQWVTAESRAAVTEMSSVATAKIGAVSSTVLEASSAAATKIGTMASTTWSAVSKAGSAVTTQIGAISTAISDSGAMLDENIEAMASAVSGAGRVAVTKIGAVSSATWSAISWAGSAAGAKIMAVPSIARSALVWIIDQAAGMTHAVLHCAISNVEYVLMGFKATLDSIVSCASDALYTTVGWAYRQGMRRGEGLDKIILPIKAWLESAYLRISAWVATFETNGDMMLLILLLLLAIVAIIGVIWVLVRKTPPDDDVPVPTATPSKPKTTKTKANPPVRTRETDAALRILYNNMPSDALAALMTRAQANYDASDHATTRAPELAFQHNGKSIPQSVVFDTMMEDKKINKEVSSAMMVAKLTVMGQPQSAPMRPAPRPPQTIQFIPDPDPTTFEIDTGACAFIKPPK